MRSVVILIRRQTKLVSSEEAMLHKIYNRIANRISYYTYRLLGRDNITLAKIVTRDDLHALGEKNAEWVIPTKLLNKDSICYCVGCGEDISFDFALIERFGCNVFAFDPTPRAIEYVKSVAANNIHYQFFEIGLWDKEDVLKFFVPKNPAHVSHSIVNLQKTEDYIEAKVKRLKDIMQVNGHSKVDLLKIDIEGAEYKVIDSIIDDKLDIRIICVEYDEFFNALDGDFKMRIRLSVARLLSAGYSLVCTQGNGNYTFVRKAHERA